MTRMTKQQQIEKLEAENRRLQQDLVKARLQDSEQEESRQAMLFLLEEMNVSRKAIEHAKRDWERTFDSVGDPIFLHDNQCRVVRANKAYAARAGKPVKEVIGKPYWQFFPQGDSPLESCSNTLAENSPNISYEEEVVLDSGEIFTSQSYLAQDDEGAYLYSIHIMKDITDRKQAEEDLKHSQAQLLNALHGTILAIAAAIEARDPYTAGHQQRVAKLARAMADRQGLDTDTQEGIQWGAMCHDIGKIKIPSEILTKPTRLSSNEYMLIKAHPQISFDILKGIDFPWPIAAIARQHHERIDGTGYPLGLKGDEICHEAKLVAVADVVEAISSHRPYREGLGLDKAREEIKRGRGLIYDTDSVDACLCLLSDGFDFSL
jgi:PAS domain S-box-containing protein/putative nucleotidyltransferase with HDIG domain